MYSYLFDDPVCALTWWLFHVFIDNMYSPVEYIFYVNQVKFIDSAVYSIYMIIDLFPVYSISYWVKSVI